MGKVIVDWDLCDGNGLCAIEAPDVFEITEDDELVVLREEADGVVEGHVRAAIRACPKRAIALG